MIGQQQTDFSDKFYRNPQLFHDWYRQQLVLGKSPNDVILELESDPFPWVFCRQMCIAHWGNLYKIREAFTEKCMSSGVKLIEAYAISLDAYMQIAWFDTSADGYNALAQQYLPMLEGYLAEILEGEPEPVRREVEASLRTTIGFAHFRLGNNALATEQGSRALFWINKVHANFMLSKSRNLIVAVNANSGQQLEEAMHILDEDRKNSSRTRSSLPFQERAYAEMLFYLGHNQQVISTLEKLSREFQGSGQQTVRSACQMFQTLLGYRYGLLDEESSVENPRGWITSSVGYLVQYGTLPATSQTKDKRDALLVKAIDVWRNNRFEELSWARILGQWVTGTANLWLGKTSSALVALNTIPSQIDSTQWLDLRILKTGLGIELALHLNNPELDLSRYLDDLRRLLCDVDKIKLASKKGLLERFIRWHPVAAAFAAVVPDGIVELQEATRAIMQVGYRNVVQGVYLPPAYMVELIFRSLDLDRVPAYRFTQADPGSGRVKRNQLMGKYGEVDYWLPTISVIRLIYGLKKSGYSETALKIANEYGILPHSNAEYVMVPVLERIGELTRQLLLDKISPLGFANRIVTPD
jgi:hypothetical protein